MEKGQLQGNVKLFPSAQGTAGHRSLCQLSARGSTRPFSFIGRQKGVEVHVRPETVDLYTEGPSPDLGAGVEVTLQKTRFFCLFVVCFSFFSHLFFLSIYLPLPECKLHEGKDVFCFIHCFFASMSVL